MRKEVGQKPGARMLRFTCARRVQIFAQTASWIAGSVIIREFAIESITPFSGTRSRRKLMRPFKTETAVASGGQKAGQSYHLAQVSTFSRHQAGRSAMESITAPGVIP